VTAAFGDRSLARYWVAGDSGAIAAVREWSDWRNTAYWWIQFVYVAPEARGRGLATQLIDHVATLAAAAGSPDLRLYVHPDNARAIRTYERIGFQPFAYRVMSLPLAGRPATAGAAVVTSDELDDDALWIAFHERSLAFAQWTHAAHLRVAWLHLARYAIDEAHLRMRVGIIRLNAAHGLVETPQRGYHETLTRVWLALVAAARTRDACTDSRAFIATHALGRDAPLRHYSRERLFSLAARTMFVEPDLAALP
jgi:GNAT superfamily N-acetyltransferase